MVTANATFDLLNPATARVVPFVTTGGGWFQTREQFPFARTFTSGDPAFTAGGGVRAAITDRVTVGGEARIGWELHLRANVTVGIRLGK